MIGLLIVMTSLNELLVSGTSTFGKCSQQNLYRSVEITCDGIPERSDWKKIQRSSSHISIICPRSLLQTSNETFQGRPLKYFPTLTFFYLAHCKLSSLKKEFFQDLIHLENVVLDNLPLVNLQKEVFKNSSNVVELTLTRLTHLKEVHPRFMDIQNNLRKLYVIQCNVTAEQMRPLLLSVYVTMVHLHWGNNRLKLFFHKTYFRDFIFDSLLLENNDIDNTDFLFHTNAKYLSLKLNPLSAIDKFLLPKLDVLESLNLASTGLNGVFPDRDRGVIWPRLRELILSNNRIEALPGNIDIMLPSLKILDVRNNRLSTLPSSLQHLLTKNLMKVMLSENIYHCNCELEWLYTSLPSIANQILCRTSFSENGTKPSNQTLTKVAIQSPLRCTIPEVSLVLDDQYKYNEYSVMIEKRNVKVYTMMMEPGEEVHWSCEGRGDPGPKLRWIFDDQVYRVAQAPLRGHETRTILSSIIVRYTNTSSVFECRGSNIVGRSSVKLRLVPGERSIARQAKIVSRQSKDADIRTVSIYLIHFMITILYVSS